MAVKEGETQISMLKSAGVEFLLSHEGQVPLSCIEGKITCLFFSANWCRPCRNFTPQLVHLYTTLKTMQKNFEIVLVSLDHDDNSFTDHFKSIPWLAVPFDVGVRRRLCSKFHIERLPSLIPLASHGMDIEEDAVKLVEDYRADAYPFGAKRRKELEAMDEAKRQGGKLEELLGREERDYLISRDGTKVLISELVGRTIGLYFGARWCPPCCSFTPMLKDAYNELRICEEDRILEIIFVSADRDEDEFRSSLDEMPWLAIPYTDRTRHDLSRIFNVNGIPTLVIIGTDGKAVTTNGRAVIAKYGSVAFPFTESRAAEVEAALQKEGEGLPNQVKDPRHVHELKLDIAKAYVCDVCRSQGRHWVFSCDLCDFDLHPSCVKGIK